VVFFFRKGSEYNDNQHPFSRKEDAIKKKIIVIGGGFGGLAAACRLAVHGDDIEIFEQRDRLGGCGCVFEINGFKFDAGPTMITAPFMYDDIFRAAGRNREDYFQLAPVTPFYRIFNSHGESFDFTNNPELLTNQIGKWSLPDKSGYKRLSKATRTIYEKGFAKLANRPYLHLIDMLKSAPELIRLQSNQSLYRFVSKFIHNDFLRRVFSVHPLLVGADPFNITSLYTMNYSLERKWGVFHAPGGTGAILDGLEKLFKELGGKVTLNAEVVEIIAEGKQVRGVRLSDGSIHRSDIIVSNADVAYTYRNLLPENRRRAMARRVTAMQYGMSLFVIYFGTRRRYTDSRLAHHNIILGERFKGTLDEINHHKLPANDLILYLHMPTLSDPSMAPGGCESFYVLSPVPNQASGIDWTKMARPYRDRIVQFLEENYLPDLRANIVAEHFIDPLYFQDTLKSFQGAAFSTLPTFTQSTWFRPHNRSEEYDNLYFVGAGTQPGAGLPGVLSSAMITEKLIK
jgi:phytoene desaturase